jgi:hypothetical protein
VGEAAALVASGRDIFPELSDDPEVQLRLFNVDPALAQRLLRSLRRLPARPEPAGPQQSGALHRAGNPP